MATAAPPLGPSLGKRGINVANFCKDFNRATTNVKPGTFFTFIMNLEKLSAKNADYPS